MKVHIFCWVILSLLFIGNGIAIYLATDYPYPGFLNVGALVLCLGAAFFFKYNHAQDTTSAMSDPIDDSVSSDVGSGKLDFDDITNASGGDSDDTNS